ncbi:MAG: MBL fold metallo-hydrolase, partial [Verrucomicrobiae bacterium]|nr:MBL fold metallo-hydrolase [Verrucomicrobiae bacterium]
MEIIVLGVGDAFTAKHVNTSFLLRHEGFTLAIDCPDRYRGVLSAASEKSGKELKLEQVDAFLITHLHGDHVNGLESVAFYRRFRENRKVNVWGQKEVVTNLWDHRLKVAMEPLFDGEKWGKNRSDQYFDFGELNVGGKTTIGPFTVEARLTLHHLPATALRITAEGKSFGYSCDTRYDPGLIEFLSSADVIFHETNVGPGHTAYE